MNLIPAIPADAPELVAMARLFHAGDGHALSAEGETALQKALEAQPYARVWKIVQDGAVAGYGVLCFSFSIEFGGMTAYLDDLYVKPAFRGHGIGTAALQAFEKIARDEGCCIFHLETEPANVKAHEFYLRHGLHDTRRRLLIKKLYT